MKLLTPELKRTPSSYCPGAAYTSCPELAKVPGLEGEEPRLMLGILDLVNPSAIS